MSKNHLDSLHDTLTIEQWQDELLPRREPEAEVEVAVPSNPFGGKTIGLAVLVLIICAVVIYGADYKYSEWKRDHELPRTSEIFVPATPTVTAKVVSSIPEATPSILPPAGTPQGVVTKTPIPTLPPETPRTVGKKIKVVFRCREGWVQRVMDVGLVEFARKYPANLMIDVSNPDAGYYTQCTPTN